MSISPRNPVRSHGRIALLGLGLLLSVGAPVEAQTPVGGGGPRKIKAAGYTLKAENQADGSILVTYELLAEPRIRTVVKQGQAFSHIRNLEGFVVGGVKGFPEILSKQANLMVDPNQAYELEVVETQFQELSFEHPYLPSRGTILRNQNPDKVPYMLAPESLRGGMYPAAVVEHGEGYLIRNLAGYNLRFAALQVDNGARRAQVYTRLVFKVKPTEVRKSVLEQDAPESRKVVKEVYESIQGMFLNAAPAQSLSRAPWPYEVGDKGEILVIHTPRDASAIQPYIDHKRAKGWTVHVQQVATGTHVKSTIQNAYAANNKILYVQLVGDWADLQCDTTTSTGETCAIDNALGLVSGNDNYFDLIIGRFSGESAAQITIQVNKTIAYENNGKQEWWSKALGMASNEGAGSGDDSESDIQHNDIIRSNKLLAKGYTAVATAYDSPGNATLGACTGPVNSGLHVINYTGHGIHYGWATTGMNITAVNGLTNGAKQPIIFSVACVVGQYNTQTCFAEAWLRKENGGAVAAMMSTIYQPWLPPMRGQDYMNDLLTGGYNYTSNPGNGTDTDHGKPTMGAIAMNAMNLMLGESQDSDSVQTTQSWVLFGDASLQVVQDESTPSAPSISSHPKNASVTVGQVATFSVTASGTGPLSYQWLRNGDAITGATSASYTTPATTSSDNNSSFTVTVSNSHGNVTSNAAILTVNPIQDVAPTITTQPADITAGIGLTATFRVVASGTPAPTYQWKKNGSDISGASSASYTTPAVTATDYGTKYSVAVVNRAGSVLSREAILLSPPTPDPTINLALKKPTSASSTYTGRPSSLSVDGVTTTRWSSKTLTSSTKTQWLSVDLGAMQTVSRAKVLWGSTYYAKDWSLQYLDGNTWTTVWSTTNATAGKWKEISFPAVNARQWRIYMTRNNLSNYTIYEVQLFGK